MDEETNPLPVDILTPERPFLNTETTLIVVPSENGDIGAMIGCAPLVCVLRPGVLVLFDETLTPTHRFFLAEGTAWITETRVSVLTRDITALDRIDLHAVRAQRQQCEGESTEYAILTAKEMALENQPYTT